MQLRQTTRQFADNIASTTEAASCPEASALAKAIYAPYLVYVAKYGIYESSQLGYQLGALEFTHEDLSDTINALSLSVAKIMDYAEEANKRCKLFSEGCAYPLLVKAYNVIGIFN